MPARWAHWLEHPCDVASVTFDVGFYTRNDLRDRKVYDVNWLLRQGAPRARPARAAAATGQMPRLRRDQHGHAARPEYRGHV